MVNEKSTSSDWKRSGRHCSTSSAFVVLPAGVKHHVFRHTATLFSVKWAHSYLSQKKSTKKKKWQKIGQEKQKADSFVTTGWGCSEWLVLFCCELVPGLCWVLPRSNRSVFRTLRLLRLALQHADRITFTLQPHKMAPTSKTSMKRTCTYLARQRIASRHPISAHVQSFSTLKTSHSALSLNTVNNLIFART